MDTTDLIELELSLLNQTEPLTGFQTATFYRLERIVKALLEDPVLEGLLGCA
jgi:hypothetical protein